MLLAPGLPLGWRAVMQAERKDLDGLVKDQARRERLDQAYAALEKRGGSGELSIDALNAVQQKYLKVTEDHAVTDAEADELLAVLEQPAPR